MYIQPNTTIHFLRGLEINNTYQDIIKFSSLNAQQSYFMSKRKFSVTDSQYTREVDGVIKVGKPVADLYDVNYIMYQNSSFSNKWFYAFVTKVEYLSNEVTKVYFELDVVNTWWFSLNFKESFVEREHSVTDNIGENRVEENLETGEYVVTSTNEFETGNNKILVCCTASGWRKLQHLYDNMTSEEQQEPKGEQLNTDKGVLDAIESACAPTGASLQVKIRWGCIPAPFYMIFNYDTTGFTQLTNYLSIIENWGFADLIVSMTLIPDNLCETALTQPYAFDTEYTLTNRVLSKTPRNNKLYIYPYCCLSVQGGTNAIELRYEDFTGTPTLEILSVTQSNLSILGIVKHYKNLTHDYARAITLTGFPQLPWSVNAYQTWLAQNQSSLQASKTNAYVSGAVQVGAGVTSAIIGGAAGSPTAIAGGIITATHGVANTYETINSLNAKIEDHQRIPDELRGQINSGTTLSWLTELTFRSYCYSIRPEFIDIIDDYFDRFGYATHRLKKPNLDSRPHWNYVKTVGCEIIASIPVQDLDKIKSIFDKGVTLWKNGDEIGDYSLDNRPQ